MTTKSSTRSIASLQNENDKGFTLIELLIVIVILGVLAGITVFAVSNFTSTSVQAACKADYKSVEVAVEAYKAQVGIYPTANQHGIPAAATDAVPVTTAGGLLAGDTVDVPNVGPWLRDQPTNGHHYQIQVPLTGTLPNGNQANGSGSVQVWKWNTTTNSFSTAVPVSGSAADCSTVS